ncbi:MAG TPA: SAM-dependent methyltransferase [Chitinophagaceae bacterium]|nr:SAM-dependent methyltransferase [Chitinophagaceae bacterium]
MATVYLIPSLLHDEGMNAIPSYIADAVKNCQVFFVENERTARRYLKKLWKEIIIDNYEWFVINDEIAIFRQKLKEGKNIGIISEAGCPGIADPGQGLVAIAQEMNIEVKPLVGPNSILLALMASGMNGQQFQFVGYLPIDNHERSKTIKELEAESKKKNCTQIFIETPYRNNQMLEALQKNCNAATKLCIAVDLTGSNEWIKTKTIADWKNEKVDIHKRLAIFLLLAK